MNVKIDCDIIDSILKAYNRCSRDQLRVYGMIMGTLEDEAYRIKNCIFGYIFEEGRREDGKTKFNRLSNESVNSLLSSYTSNFPNEMILGGFATDKELFPELYNLHSTIGLISSKTLVNKNNLLLLVDPFHHSDSKIEYGVQVFQWNVHYQQGKHDEDMSLMSFKRMDFSIIGSTMNSSIMHSDLNNSGEIALNIENCDIPKSEEKNYKGIFECIKNSVEMEMKNLNYADESKANLCYLKKQIMLTERYVIVIEKFLEDYCSCVEITPENQEILHNIDMIFHEVSQLFESDEVFEIIQKEFKSNQIIDSVINLLNVQVKFTEKINKLNL